MTLRTRTIAIALALGLLLGLGATSAQSQDRLTMRIATAANPADYHAGALYVFKEYLERAVPGRFNVEIYPSASLFQQGTEPAALQRGNLEATLLSAQDISRQVAPVSALTAGYLVRDPAHLCEIWSGDVGTELKSLVADEMGIQILEVFYLGTRQLTMRRPIDVQTPADLAGVKLRMPDSQAWLFLGNALGADATPLAFGELYLALQTGTVDGQDNPLPSVVVNKFYEVSQQVILTSHLVDGVLFAISDTFWNRLDASEQQIMRDASRAAALFNNLNRIRAEREVVEYLEGQGLSVVTPDVNAFRETVQDAYLNSSFSDTWLPGFVDTVNALEPRSACQF
ncbi:TRAP transporter substrate-binding protein DctP [soil metagenome]|nr:TRAP transporter substrate-binding protein DctP [Trueperaceae bacterium]